MPRSHGVVGALLACGMGCGLLSGVDDLQVDDDAFDASVGSTDAPILPLSEGSVGSCGTGNVEICDDGIDNDCNGLTDCADQACVAGFACVPAPAQGWTFASASLGARPQCPAGLAATDIVIAPVDGPTSCSCACSTTDTTCTTGAYVFGFGSACDGGTIPMTGTGCGVANAQLTKDTPTQLQAPLPATCNATLKKALAQPENGRLCEGPVRAGGCVAGQVCAPRVATGAQTCVAQEGAQTCPAAYGTKLQVGTGVQTDTRDCTACTCQPSPCTASVDLFANPNCNGKTLTIQSSKQCLTQQVPNDLNLSSFMLKQMDGGCAPAQPSTLTGTLTLADPQTLCCR